MPEQRALSLAQEIVDVLGLKFGQVEFSVSQGRVRTMHVRAAIHVEDADEAAVARLIREHLPGIDETGGLD